MGKAPGMVLRYVILALASSMPALVSGADNKVIFAITAANSMPLGQIENNVLTGGILKDLSDALAQALGREPAYVVLPRRRVFHSLVTGDADVRCYAMPEWDDIDVHWSKPLIPNSDIVAMRRGAQMPAAPQALAGIRVGTVANYRYAPLEKALGVKFVRDDAPSELQNLTKLATGRFDYAVANTLSFRYFVKTGQDRGQLAKEYLVLKNFEAQCALSKNSRIYPQQFHRAIDELRARKRVEQILAKYR